jgi:S1-C subfamily serine protease
MERMTYDRRSQTLSLLGVTLAEIDLDQMVRQKLSSARGVAVLSVREGSEAAHSGISRGDFVAEVNNRSIASLLELCDLLAGHNPRDPIFVFLLSNGIWRFVTLSFMGLS